MAYNIMTFGVRGVDADALTAGNQQLNGNVGPNELTAANLINANGIPFQQLLLFMGAANNGDLNINAGETAFNLSDMGPSGAVVSLGVTNNNDPLKIRANGLTSANTVGDLTANVYYDNTIGFGLANIRDKTAASSWLNSGDSLTFSTMAINGVNQFIASASFVVNVNGGGSEHVVIDFDGNVMHQNGTATAVDGIDLGLIANGTTVSLNFAAHTISIGATTRVMTDAELSLFQQGGLNQVTIGSLNTSTQGFAIKNLAIVATDTPVSGVVVHAPATGGETHGTANDDILIGSAVADILNSGAGNDVVYGGAGNDIINAGDGNDVVYGGNGDDVINGGAGNDIIVGGPGNDTMTGGAGADNFVFSSLNDLTATTDHIADLDHLDTISLPANGGLSFIGQNAFSGTSLQLMPGQVRFDVALGTTTIQIDVNGDGQFLVADDKDFVIDNGQFNLAETTVGSLVLVAPSIFGTGSDDVLNGTNQFDDQIFGLSGNDTINGGARNDTIDGGDGDDTLAGGDGIDTIYGGAGNDFIQMQPGGLANTGIGEFAYGGAGDDLIRNTSGDDYINGGDGFDRVTYSQQSAAVTVDLRNQAQITGGGGNDTLINIESVAGTNFGDTLIGNDGANSIIGQGGDDHIQGLGGDDILIGDLIIIGNDVLDGGDGIDTVTYILDDRTEGVSIDLALGVAGTLSGGETDTLISIENAQGTGFADTIIGDDNNNVLTGGEGNDYLDGGDGIDTVSYEENVPLVGFVSSRTEGVGVDLAAGVGGTISGGETDTFIGIENVIGTSFDDEIFGNAFGNMLNGLGGADFINGNAGNDVIYGGDGDDTVNGGDGLDTIYGGAGNDFIVLERPNTPNAGSGEFAYGGDGDDGVRSSSGDDLIDGGNGTDRVTYFSLGSADDIKTVHVDLNQQGAPQNTGDGGWDTLISIENVSGTQYGNDVLVGNNEANLINGNGGADTLTGGGGADTFVFITPGGDGDIDHITDFSVIDDTISLDSGIFGLAAGALSADAFHVGSEAADVDDRIIYDSATGELWFDADGSGAGAAVHFATLSAGLALTSDDFIIVGP